LFSYKLEELTIMYAELIKGKCLFDFFRRISSLDELQKNAYLILYGELI